jgi:hypothetical protein
MFYFQFIYVQFYFFLSLIMGLLVLHNLIAIYIFCCKWLEEGHTTTVIHSFLNSVLVPIKRVLTEDQAGRRTIMWNSCLNNS